MLWLPVEFIFVMFSDLKDVVMKNHYTKQGPSAYSIWHVAKYTKMILSRWNNYFLANLRFFVKSIYAIGSGKGIENAKPLSCCVHNTTTCNRNYSNFSLDLKFLLDGVSFTSSWAPVNIVWCCLYFLMVFTPLLDLGTDQRCYHLFSAGLGEVAAKTSCGPRRTLGDGSIYIYISLWIQTLAKKVHNHLIYAPNCQILPKI